MTQKQEEARQVNFSIRRINSAISNIKDIRDMYPNLEHTANYVLSDLYGMVRHIKANRYKSSFKIIIKK